MFTPRIREGKLYLENNILSLQEFKHMASLSEETNCFTATVFWNSYKIGSAKNTGNGAETFVYPDSKNKDIFDAAQIVIKEARIGFKSEYSERPFSIDSLDIAVDFLVDSLIMAKATKKAIKKLDKEGHFLVGLKKEINGDIVSCGYIRDYLFNRKAFESSPLWAGEVDKRMQETQRNYDLVINRSMPDFYEKYLEFLGLNKEVELVDMAAAKPRTKAG